jgi:hypothetical protein
MCRAVLWRVKDGVLFRLQTKVVSGLPSADFIRARKSTRSSPCSNCKSPQGVISPQSPTECPRTTAGSYLYNPLRPPPWIEPLPQEVQVTAHVLLNHIIAPASTPNTYHSLAYISNQLTSAATLHISNMAPSLLLPDESQAQHYSEPVKRASKPSAVSLESHAPVGGSYSFNGASANGNGQVNGDHTVPNGRGTQSQQRDGHDFITSQSLLQQSQNYASQNRTANGGSKRPNILYIMADQMAAPLLKMNDPNSVIKTPHLDELAKTGVNFASAYCNSPLCAPSRFTMCTGQLPSKIGGYDNASILGPEVPTYAHYLRREGYETALAGKMHFIGPDQLHGFEHR